MVHNRSEFVVAAFAAGGRGVALDPLQAQKLLFLINREVSKRIGGPFFDFQPYYNGPFDWAVFNEIDSLVAGGDITSDLSGRYPRFLLTEAGYQRGVSVLGRLPDPTAGYFGRVGVWVRLVSDRETLAAIYAEYPDMAPGNGVQDLAVVRPASQRRGFLQGMASVFDFTWMEQTWYTSEEGSLRDADAIRGDWRAVGADLENAMARLGNAEGPW